MPHYDIDLNPDLLARCKGEKDTRNSPLALALREQHGLDVHVWDYSTGADCVQLVAANDPRNSHDEDGSLKSPGMRYEVDSLEAAKYEQMWDENPEWVRVDEPAYTIEVPAELVALASVKGGPKVAAFVREAQSDFKKDLIRLRDSAAAASMDQHWGDKELLRAVVALYGAEGEDTVEDEDELAIAATSAIRNILFEIH